MKSPNNCGSSLDLNCQALSTNPKSEVLKPKKLDLGWIFSEFFIQLTINITSITALLSLNFSDLFWILGLDFIEYLVYLSL